MNEVIEFLKGKKTYFIAGAIAVLGTLQGLGVFVVPEVAWTILGALGLAFIRAGVNKVSDAVKDS